MVCISHQRGKMIIFIPIKQNSQRVPKKNFRMFKNAPLYKHVLRKFNKHNVFVDTDSQEILEECKKDKSLSHVHAFSREKHLLGDRTSVCKLIENFIEKFQIIDPIVQTHVTSPFMDVKTLEDAYKFLTTHDSVVSCNVFNSRFWRKESYGYCPVNHNPLKLEQTQDLPVFYEENSAFYMFYPAVLKDTGNRIGSNPYFYNIGHPYNLDIDTEKDWEMVLKEANNAN